MPWKCKQCGLCCETLADRDEWKRAPKFRNPNSLNTKRLLYERNRRKLLKKGCEMLYQYGSKKLCMIHTIFGYAAKPKGCKEFGEKDCLQNKKPMQIQRKHGKGGG